MAILTRPPLSLLHFSLSGAYVEQWKVPRTLKKKKGEGEDWMALKSDDDEDNKCLLRLGFALRT